MKVGKITQSDIIKFNRIASREMSLENSTGWVSVNKAFKSKKSYSRKQRHKDIF
jgi:hypothetical protein